MVRGFAAIVALSALAIPLAGCDTAISILAGEPHGPQGTAKSKIPPLQANYGFTQNNQNSLDQQSGLTGQGILPPTVPINQGMEPSEEPEASADTGPHPPIAVARLADDPSGLSGLASAAAKANMRQNARFVLLVLSPPPTDASAIGQAGAQSRAAAAAGVKAITGAGVEADQIEVAAATSATAGDGEMRLYAR